MNKQICLSIIIPAYNEEKKIKNDITRAFNFFKKENINGEVIISTDGVTDNTNKIVKRLQKKYINLTLLSKKHKIGKGMAIKKGVEKAIGKYIMFADAGYCVPFNFIKIGIKTLQNGNDCAIASRACKASKIKRKQPLYRQLGSKMFGIIVRNLLGIPKHIKDTQCGFKIYKKNVAKQIFKKLKTDSFMFDILCLISN